MRPIIKIDRVSKRYEIGQRGRGYETFREALVGVARRAVRSRPKQSGSSREVLWALDQVTFDVPRGEVVGIVGRNGAGKSTLLKVLSRITEPTSGKVQLWGRVSSLLEVGTGFHPELTGRDNIFLNGAILGMRRSEIRSKFDEIVSFAEIDRFVDTPVKHFSSGMYLRLAFAVAAHLEPEILVVDEVLAVGDHGFQQKCLGKMAELGDGGRTVLFVSHNMPAVLRLCSRVIALDEGRVVDDGDPSRVARRYLRAGTLGRATRSWPSIETAPGDDVARLQAVRIRNADGENHEVIDIERPCTIEVDYWNLQSKSRPSVLLQLSNQEGVCLFQTNDFNDRGWRATDREPGMVRSICELPGNLLAEGLTFVTVGIGTYNPNALHALEHNAIAFEVVDRSRGEAARGEYVGEWPGVLRPMLKWTVTAQPGPVSEAGPRAQAPRVKLPHDERR